MRFHVRPRCVPPAVAARRLGMTHTAFRGALPQLNDHGFPSPDPVTGNYDLEAIDRYIAARNPHFFGSVDDSSAITDEAVMLQRIAELGNAGG